MAYQSFLIARVTEDAFSIEQTDREFRVELVVDSRWNNMCGHMVGGGF